MSSDPTIVRFSKSPVDVRTAGQRAEPKAAEAKRPRGDERIAQLTTKLQLAEQQLARREAEVAAREAAIAGRERAVEERMHELAVLISSVRQERAEMLEENEEEIVSFSLSITEKVLQHEIENGRYKIGEVVKSALRAVRDEGSLVVRVNPRDYEMTKAALNSLGQTMGTTRINPVPDDSIPLASCCIETNSGKVFSEIPGRLKRIEQSLLKKNGDSDGV